MGKTGLQATLSERGSDYPAFQQEFGHLEGDTIVGLHHKSAIITLVERLSKVIITLKPAGRKAKDIERATNQ
ncbi:IS30 family transposase [Enterococcus rivorum]|nr:IS30 family transposase [Enterococcus rivorum]